MHAVGLGELRREIPGVVGKLSAEVKVIAPTLGTKLLKILYFPLGVLFFLWGIAQVVVMCCTIVLLPMAIPYAKSLSTFFNPVGKVCVPVAVMDELERRKAEKEVDAYLNK